MKGHAYYPSRGYLTQLPTWTPPPPGPPPHGEFRKVYSLGGGGEGVPFGKMKSGTFLGKTLRKGSHFIAGGGGLRSGSERQARPPPYKLT